MTKGNHGNPWEARPLPVLRAMIDTIDREILQHLKRMADKWDTTPLPAFCFVQDNMAAFQVDVILSQRQNLHLAHTG